MREVVLDTETTGLDPLAGHRVVEIGCIELVNRRLTGRQLHHYVNPQRSSHPDALRVHGLTDDFLSQKPPFAAIADEVIEFIAGADVIIHNASFDVAFIDAELRRLDRQPVRHHVLSVTDSLLLARELFPGKANSLDALCRRLEVDNSHRDLHGALLDAGLLAEVYLRMTRGQGSLVIDAGEEQGDGPQVAQVDLATFVLPVLMPSAEEIAAHEAVLADLDKACGGKTIWRRLQAAPEAPEVVA